MVAAIETKKKPHDKKLLHNYAANIFRKYDPKHPWLNNKLRFSHITTVENRENSNTAVPPPYFPDQQTNIADNEDSTPIPCAK